MITSKKILLTGATGYIGRRLLPILVEQGYHVVCCVRDLKRFSPPKTLLPYITAIKVDLLKEKTLNNILQKTNTKHLIYLSGIVNDSNLSKHLASRKNVENELAKGQYNFTTLRAGIIIGSGSASFEIIRDLVEKLPIMVAPKWLNTKCQPIGIIDVLKFLSLSLFNNKVYNSSFDIGGPDILTYKEMFLSCPLTGYTLLPRPLTNWQKH